MVRIVRKGAVLVRGGLSVHSVFSAEATRCAPLTSPGTLDLFLWQLRDPDAVCGEMILATAWSSRTLDREFCICGKR